MTLLSRYGTLAGLVMIVIAFAAASPDGFAQPGNLINITQQMSLLAIVALGATFVMALAEFDLSVGAMVSFSGIAAVTVFQSGFGIAATVAATLAACAVIGFAAGFLIASFRMPSFIVTLAVGTMVGGLTFWISDGATLFTGIPDAFRALGRGAVAGIPVLTLWAVAMTAISVLVLDHSEIGRRILAIGGNREAARLAGVPIRRDMAVAFGLSAAFAGVAGLLLSARLGSAHPTGGHGFLLQAYAAAFLGMTAFRDGEPNALGTLLGAGIIAVIANGLTVLGVPNFLQDIMTGLIIIAAVLVRSVGYRSR